jgi:hypothetical protein
MDVSPPHGRIIPLTPGIARPAGERRAALREAVTQVVRHLVVGAVPFSQGAPLFELAAGLLDEAGWGLDELVAAADPGPAQEDLLCALGLAEPCTS